ncbi:RNA polymerase sigma factor [Chryseobacterium culicis]|jgi:RNA polymerase sigma-70 factor (ECF subfamily)|uniref:RNA polymerase sigma factor n=1 Tax=Chryseobacterium culicis TaxID=680127 RepID=UPI001874C72A|nr:RNA polymerase sigma factor [Chryseobacterium culicis]MBE4949442.1 RNA polymerase sigma factor [Chryseobacterium culicis]
MDFDEIYNTYSQKIFRVCLGYFNDYDIARDMTQETFIAVWESIGKFEQRSEISTWIYRIATNKCLRQIQKNKNHLKTNFPENLKQEEYNVEKDERLSLLQKYISELPEIERIMIALSLNGLPQEEIAEITGSSHANCRVMLHRIKKKLMKKIEDDGRF